MALQKQIFNNISTTKFSAFTLKVEQDTGVKMEGDSGTVVHGPITFDWTYLPEAETLTIQVMKKPFFMHSTSVVNAISEEVAELKG